MFDFTEFADAIVGMDYYDDELLIAEKILRFDKKNTTQFYILGRTTCFQKDLQQK